MPYKKQIRERDIDQAVVRYAKSRKCLCYKFSSPSHRGVCDRIIVGSNGVVLFLELKRPGEKPTALQAKFINEVNSHGAIAEWTNNVNTAKTFIDLYCCH